MRARMRMRVRMKLRRRSPTEVGRVSEQGPQGHSLDRIVHVELLALSQVEENLEVAGMLEEGFVEN